MKIGRHLAVVALAALLLSVSGSAAALEESWPSDQNAKGFKLYNLPAPTLGTSALRLQDATPGNCILQSTGVNGTIVCSTLTGFSATAPLVLTGSVLTLSIDSSLAVNAGVLQRPALTGAITAAAGSNATAFGPLSAYSVLANATGSSAVPAALAAGSDGIVLGRFASALTFHQLVEADIQGLTGDLAGKVPTTRTLTMSGPLTCGGGGSCDLSADRTLGLTIDSTLASGATLSVNSYALTTRATNAGANMFNLGALSTGLMKLTVSGSVATPSIAAAGTDFQGPMSAADATIVLPTATTIQRGALIGDVAASSGSTSTTIQPNVVTNHKSAQMAAATIKGNTTGALADAQDVAATATGQVPLATASGWGWSMLDQSTGGGMATWGTAGSLRYYAVDTASGSDANACFSDVSQAAAGLIPCKTMGRALQLLPKIGAGRAARVAVKGGAYSSDTALDLSGFSGYQSITITGTDTIASAGATAFAGDLNDWIAAGMKIATGTNAGGYNSTAYSTNADGGATMTLQLAGGGSPAFGAMPAYPYGARFRWSSTTTTTALRNATSGVLYVSGGNTVILSLAFPASPVAGDVGYFEIPGVTGPTSTLISESGGASGFLSPWLQIVGLSMGRLDVHSSGVYFVGCESSVFISYNSTAAAVEIAGIYPFVSPFQYQVGNGMRTGTVDWRGGNYRIGGLEMTSTTAGSQIHAPSLMTLERFASGSQLIAYGGDLAHGNNIIDSIGSNSSTVHGSAAQIWGTGTGTGGVTLSGLALYGGYQIGRVRFSNMGSHPAIAIGGSGFGIHLQGATGGASDGNTGVGVTMQPNGLSGNTDGAAGNDIIVAASPAVTGSGGDIQLPDGTIVTWAQAAAGIIDSQGNRWIGAGTAFPIQQTTSGTLLTSLVGTGVRYVKASALGLLSAASATIPWTDITGAPTSFPPSGAAGGDLTGTYPNPTIASHAVTGAKFRQSAASSLVGNPTGSTADASDITLGAGCSFSGTTLTCPGTGVPTTRTISTTAPLTGGGDLSANRTLAISDFVASGASHARGAVPDPGSVAGATKYLREDGSWAIPPGTSSGSVTDVGATLPLTSTHGATPTIALNYDAATITLNGSNQIQVAAQTGDVTKAAGSNATAISANVVTNAKLAQMGALTIKGNNTGGTANALDLTAAQTTAMLDLFTSSLKGLVPGSGGGTANFLRADGTWAAPPAGGGGTITDVSATLPLTSTHGATPTIAVNYDAASITLNGSNQLQRAALGGDVTATAGSNTTAIAANAVTDAKLRQGGALSVIGRSANSTGNVADIAATAGAGFPLRESGSTIGFGAIGEAAVTNLTTDLAGKQATITWPAATRVMVSSGSGITSDATFTYGSSTLNVDSINITGTGHTSARVHSGGLLTVDDLAGGTYVKPDGSGGLEKGTGTQSTTWKWSVNGSNSGLGIQENGMTVIIPSDAADNGVTPIVSGTGGLTVPQMVALVVPDPRLVFYPIESTYDSGGVFTWSASYINASGSGTGNVEVSVWMTTAYNGTFTQLCSATNTSPLGTNFGSPHSCTFATSVPANNMIFVAIRRTDANSSYVLSRLAVNATLELAR